MGLAPVLSLVRYTRGYISHTTQVEVLDAGTGKVIGVIANTPGVHGIAIASRVVGTVKVGGAGDHLISGRDNLIYVSLEDTAEVSNAVFRSVWPRSRQLSPAMPGTTGCLSVAATSR